jgi:hypothetical protein
MAVFDSSGRRVVLFLQDGYAYVLDLKSANIVSKTRFDDNSFTYFQFAVGSDLGRLAISKSDPSVSVFQTTTGEATGYRKLGNSDFYPIALENKRVVFLHRGQEDSLWAAEIMPQNLNELRRMVEGLRLCPLSPEERRKFALDDPSPEDHGSGNEARVAACGSFGVRDYP